MEGLPVVLMEAMALGTAVIASRVAGIPELIEEDNSGLLFTPSKWDELAECMIAFSEMTNFETLSLKKPSPLLPPNSTSRSPRTNCARSSRKLHQVTIFPGFDRIGDHQPAVAAGPPGGDVSGASPDRPRRRSARTNSSTACSWKIRRRGARSARRAFS